MYTDLQNLGFSNKELKQISWYVNHHHRPYEITTAKGKNQKKKVRELYTEV
jgi:hypothetical protein